VKRETFHVSFMVKILKLALLILITLLLQVTLVARISFFGSRIDLLLTLIIALALLKEIIHVVLIGFISGLVYDGLSGGPLGVQSFTLVVFGYAVEIIRDRIYADNPVTQALFGFGITIGAKLITSVYLGLFADPNFLNIRPLGLISVAIINSLLVIAFSWILKKFLNVKKVE
jgi:rod shape-determining protein MreD